METKRTGENGGGPFKRCNLCGKEWHSREEFLNDKAVVLNGYQWNVQNVHLSVGSGGLLLFTHQADQCGTTMALSASLFKAIRRKAERSARKQSPASSPIGNNQPVPVPVL